MIFLLPSPPRCAAVSAFAAASLVLVGGVSPLHAQDAGRPPVPATMPTPTPGASPASSPAADTAPNAPTPAPLPETVATVNGEPIKRAELERVSTALLAINGRTPEELTPDERKKLYRSVTEELVTDRLVAKEAAGVKVTDAEIDKRLEQLKAGVPAAEFDAELKRTGQSLADLKKNLRAEAQQQRWMEGQIAGQIKVADPEIEDYYQKNPDNFQAPETIRASHILVRVTQDATPEIVREKENFANSLRDRLVDKKESFAELAKQSDDAGTRDKGGDLGFFSRDRMVPEFADAAFTLGKDEISKPVRTNFGFHLIKLTDRQPSRLVPLAEAKENIRSFLESDKRRQALSQLIAKLHEGAKVQINVP